MTTAGKTDTLRSLESTRQADGFNWLALNVGTNYPSPTSDNVHHVTLFAKFDTQTNKKATTFGTAAVFSRTLILDPVKAAHGATVTTIG